MTLTPLIQRELRATARWPAFYWLRGSLTLLAGLKAYQDLSAWAVTPPAVATGQTAGRLAPAALTAGAITGAELLDGAAWIGLGVALALCLFTVDCLGREKREGTLGLLLLTDLTPTEIVLGKFITAGLAGFATMLGLVPALMIAILAGGVSGGQALGTGLALLNALFVSLAAGIGMSAIFRERRHSLVATLGLLAFFLYGARVLGAAFLAQPDPLTLDVLSLRGPLVVTGQGAARAGLVEFVISFGVFHAVGWLLLLLAQLVLAQTWRDNPRPPPRRRPPDLGLDNLPTTASGAGVAPWWQAGFGAAPWEADPVRWRAEQIPSQPGLIWTALLIGFLAYFGVLSGDTLQSGFWFVASARLAGLVLMGSLLALAGARFFLNLQTSGELESLATTPQGHRELLRGQRRALGRRLLAPSGLVLLLALPSLMGTLAGLVTGDQGVVALCLPPLLIALNLLLEAVTLCWVGARFALGARTPLAAVWRAVLLVEVLPALGLLGFVTLKGRFDLPSGATEALVSLLLLGKNLACLTWAVLSLRGRLNWRR